MRNWKFGANYGKQCVCDHKHPNPPIPPMAETGGFQLVEVPPNAKRIQKCSEKHGINPVATRLKIAENRKE